MPYVATLTAADLDFGKRITEQLKTAKFSFNGTFWLYDEAVDDWQLTIATELVDKLGPRNTYLQLSRSISSVSGSDFQLLRIAVISPRTAVYAALRRMFGTTANVEGVRLQRAVVNGILISDAYLYQIK
jgi:hypothetical protein